MVDIQGIKYISEKEASQRYCYSQAWFQKRRRSGLPPPFIKLEGKGKVYYPLNKIEEWFKQNMKLSGDE